MVPVVVEPVTLSPLYAPLIHLDLTGLDEAAAVARLRDRLAGGRPTTAPPFSRAERPTDELRFGGTSPAVWQRRRAIRG